MNNPHWHLSRLSPFVCPSLPSLMWPQRESPGPFAIGENRPINVTATLNDSTSSQREWTHWTQRANFEGKRHPNSHLLVSLSERLRLWWWRKGQWAQTPGAVFGSVGGALCGWGECQGATSNRTWCSLKSCSSSWIPAHWSSHRWMKSGPTCT